MANFNKIYRYYKITHYKKFICILLKQVMLSRSVLQ